MREGVVEAEWFIRASGKSVASRRRAFGLSYCLSPRVGIGCESMNERKAFPLSWPEGWKRTTTRTRAQFGRTETQRNEQGHAMYAGKKRLSVADAVQRLLVELRRMGVPGLKRNYLDQRSLTSRRIAALRQRTERPRRGGVLEEKRQAGHALHGD